MMGVPLWIFQILTPLLHPWRAEALANHQAEGCKAGAPCQICGEIVPSDQMEDHLQEQTGDLAAYEPTKKR